MATVRRRYYIWLVRAYIKRWSKTIISSLILGVVAFFIFFFILNFYFLPVFQKKVQKIGYWGTYQVRSIPEEILSDVSYGLTKVNPNGSVSPAAAFRWAIRDNGKSYTFYIKKGQYFNNGHELTANNLNIAYRDVKKKVIDEYTVEFDLRESYAPFLIAVSKPIFENNLAGLGAYKVSKIDVNGGFVKSIIIENKKNSAYRKIITFYPTQDALKSAYALGEVDQAIGLSDITIKGSSFADWTNTDITKKTNHRQLLALFFNNSDSNLSDKKVREALSYAIPPSFSQGERAYSPISPESSYFSKGPNYGISDTSIASSLISDNKDIKKTTFEISTTDEFSDIANLIVSDWAKIGVKAKVKIVSEFPSNFQMLLYPLTLPVDPDQYTLWHSAQIDNIAKFKDLRIDKLLEDGRSTTDTEERFNIYSDFQKYIIDDAPAAFIYFPYQYNLKRR